MNIQITGRGMELTEAIKAYVDKKLGALEKFYDRILKADVKVGKETDHHLKGNIFFCECRLDVPGVDLFASKSEKNLYKAIDKVRDYLELELKKHKILEREKIKKDKRRVREEKEYKF
jgi:putative sigma-54 modulation protein